MSTDTTIDEINGYSPYELAKLAGCGSPDDNHSIGAKFLARARDAFTELVENVGHSEVASMRDSSTLTYLADSLVPIYTHHRWLTFVDLLAYNVDIDDYVSDETDMTDRAGVALFVIAETLIGALLTEMEDAAEADDDEMEN